MEDLDALRSLITRHCPNGRLQTAIPRVTLVRSDVATMPIGNTYRPALCIVAQGEKRALIGENIFEYGSGKYLIVSMDMPISGGVTKASREEPYLAFTLALEPAMLAALLLDLPPGPPAALSPVMALSPLSADLLDPVVRLVRLLDRPHEIPILAPLVEREILFRLIEGPQGAMLRQIALADSQLSRITRVIDWITRNFAKPFRIDAAAQIANMSPSSLHRHFKAATMMSPLQFQKHVRLQEARRLLIAQRADAASIGFAVGYESPSQFTREYARLFGSPPGRDGARLRRVASLDPRQIAEPL